MQKLYYLCNIELIMAETLALEIMIWVFFIFAIAICKKADRDGVEWLKWISGVISAILAIVGLIGLVDVLLPYMSPR